MNLDYHPYDADNHLYEPIDAFTRHLPERYRGAIRYVDVDGRTKIAINNKISEYIPNPTFEVVAPPGAWEEYYRGNNPEGKTLRELTGKPIRCHPAFRHPDDRIKLLDEQGVYATLLFPTLASLLEERMKDDIQLTHAAISAFNRWMLEEWTFNYHDRIFPTPIITLPDPRRAIDELEWCVDNGARAVLIRPAPVPAVRGSRSMGLPEFDDFGMPLSKPASWWPVMPPTPAMTHMPTTGRGAETSSCPSSPVPFAPSSATGGPFSTPSPP